MTPDVLADAVPSALPPLWRMLTEFGYFLGLSAAIGFPLTYWVAVRPALDRSGTDAYVVASRRRAAALLASSGVLLLVTGYFQLASRVARGTKGMSFGEATTPAAMWRFLSKAATPGDWIASGTIYLVQNVLVLLLSALLISLFFKKIGSRIDTIALFAFPAAMLASLIGSTPTRATALDTLMDRYLTQVHIIGGTAWLGGLTVLVALVLAGRREATGVAAIWADIWQRFSTLALVAVGGVLLSGLWLTWKNVGDPAQLVTTTFGRFLLLKLILVVGLVTAGGFNQLWLIPRVVRARLAGSEGSLVTLVLRHFPKVVAIEVVLGIGVLTVVPFLSGSARAQAGETAEPPVATGGILLIGLLLTATVVASFFATAKASDLLAQRAQT
ncbi:copper resistance D family protein [Fodinicola feengrottensis]|uniref:Copper resistance protein D domain-containing protein n=1 Tax=Fodinicola feengrottensis TaxID=435914 RepID=A0ABN2HKN7_9ACTN|nr:CopD family protein [Fodinicola feengrottensis]